MRKLIITLIIVILLVNFCFPVSVDIKTKFAEKVELRAVKKGTEVFLEKKGISVVEENEDFTVWLKDFQRLYKGNNRYYYNLTVKLSYPTAFIEKEAIKERMIHFEVFVDQPITDEIEALEDYFGDVSDKDEKRRTREAYIGGKAAADCIVEFLESKIKLKITDPEMNGIKVEMAMDVKGTATIPSGNYLWILVHRIKGFNKVWWPQGEAEIDPVTKEWEVHVVFGGPQDIGFEFEIAAVVVNETEHSRLQNYWNKAMSSESWPPIPMPPTVTAPVIRNVKKTGH